MHRPPLLAAVTVALALGGAGAAQAATFHLEGGTLVYTAAPGTTNWTFAELGSDTSLLRISDGGEHIQPGAGCTLPDPGDDTAVECPMPARLRLELGDGDDRDSLREDLPALPIEIRGGAGNDALSANNDVDNQVTLDGGEGDDTLDGMQYADTLLGGPGKDALRGNGGDDVLRGGDGNDELEPDTMPDVIGNDVVDGGAGYDTVKDWGSASEDPAFSVSISVDGIANDGRPAGEADNVIDVERFDALEPGHYVLGETADSIDLPDFGTSIVEGRGGNDTLTGGDGVETIDGGAGDDRLEGGYNNDVITGGPGRDTIYGDETSQRCSYLEDCVIVPFGNDTINARDGEPDVIDCGVGNDTATVDAVDTVSGCETVNGRPADGGGGIEPPGGGPGPKPGAACKVPGKLKGRTVASARKRLRAAHCRTIKTRKVRSRTVRRGRVVRAVRHGKVVTVYVSRGRRSAAAAAAGAARAASLPGMGKDIAYAVRVEGQGTYSYTEPGNTVALNFTYTGEITDGVIFRNASPLDTTGTDLPLGTADGTYTVTGSGPALTCTLDTSSNPARGRMRMLDTADLDPVLPLDGAVHLTLRPFEQFDVMFNCPGEDAHPGASLATPPEDGKNPFDIDYALPRDIIGMGSIQQLDPSRTIEGVACPGWIAEQTTSCRLTWTAKVTLTKLWENPVAADPPSTSPDDDLLLPLVPAKKASLRRDASKASFSVTCRTACSGTAALTAATPRGGARSAAAKPLATARFRVAQGRTRTVTIKLGARARRAVRRAHGAQIVVRTSAGGHRSTHTLRLRLRR